MKALERRITDIQEHVTDRVNAACKIMAANIERPKSVKSVAQAVGASEFHFYRIFKKVTGSTPHVYYLSIRLTHAARLLQTTNLPVADVAYQTGFTDVSAFSRAFGKAHRQTPTQFRLMKRA